MDTTPTVTDLHQQLVTEMSSLAHKSVTVSYVLIAVLVAVLGLAGFGAYLGLRSYEAQVARAEATEAQYNLDRKAWAETLATHDAERVQEAQQEAILIAQIAQREKTPPPPAVQDALSPTATAQATAIGLAQAFGGNIGPKVLQGDQIAISQPDAKLVISGKLAGDKAEEDLVDGKALYGLKVAENTSLTGDLDQCKQQNTESEKVIQAYKKAAKRSVFKKILDGAEKGVILAAGIALGHYI